MIFSDLTPLLRQEMHLYHHIPASRAAMGGSASISFKGERSVARSTLFYYNKPEHVREYLEFIASLFKDADSNGDFVLDREEIETLARDSKEFSNEYKVLGSVYDNVDEDKNGKVSLAEFIKAFATLHFGLDKEEWTVMRTLWETLLPAPGSASDAKAEQSTEQASPLHTGPKMSKKTFLKRLAGNESARIFVKESDDEVDSNDDGQISWLEFMVWYVSYLARSDVER